MPASEATYDVVAIGNALVDVLSHEDESFPARVGVESGAMTLVDEERSEQIYAAMGPGTEVSGGSAANTVAGVASFGGRAAYIGKVRDDEMGRVFRHDLRSAGVAFETPAAGEGPSTGRCLVVVTPDAQRTMSTFLGIAPEIHRGDVDAEVIGAASITYVEGYLWDRPEAKDAIVAAAEVARACGRRMAFTLSDPFCVDRHRAEFLDLVDGHVDLLFANEAEICSLYETGDFDVALQKVRGHSEIAVLTRSEHGSVVVADGEVHVVAAAPVDHVVDTTGAGDLFAAGFLYGLTYGRDLATCAHLGAAAAAEVISHLGARPQAPLSEVAAAILSRSEP